MSKMWWYSWDLPSEDQVQCVAQAEGQETESSPLWCASYHWHWWPCGAFHHLQQTEKDTEDVTIQVAFIEGRRLFVKAKEWMMMIVWLVLKQKLIFMFSKWWECVLCVFPLKDFPMIVIENTHSILFNEVYLFQWRAHHRPSPCLGSCAQRSVYSARCVSAAGECCGSHCPSGNGPWQSWALYQACAKMTGCPFAWHGWSRTVWGAN